MKIKLLLFAILLLIPDLVFAQQIDHSGSGGGGSFPPAGCSATNGVIINNATPCSSNFTSDGSGNTINVGSFTLGAGPAIVTSLVAATWQFGAADVNGAPVAQILKFQSALAGSATNTGSANTTIVGSLGTGTGTNGNFIIQCGVKTTTGTVQATATPCLTLAGETLAVTAFGPISAPATGSQTASVYNFGTLGTGMYGGASTVAFTVGGSFTAFFGSGTFTLNTNVNNLNIGASFNWNSDTFITRGGAAATFRFGANSDAVAPVAQTTGVQNVLAGTSNTGGANWIWNGSVSTGTGVGGKIIAQVSKTGTTGSAQNTNFPLLTLNPGGATTATVQFGDGTNFTTYDSCTALTTGATGIVACTASAIRFKEMYAPQPLNLAGLVNLRTDVPWRYRDDVGHGLDPMRIHVGLFADDVEKLDPRCVVYRADGLSDYEDRCIIAYLVAEVQYLHKNIGR